MGLRGKMEAPGVGRRSPPSLLRTSPSFLELEAIAAVAVEEVEFLSMVLDHVENTRVRERAMEVEVKDVQTAPLEMDCRVPSYWSWPTPEYSDLDLNAGQMKMLKISIPWIEIQ